MRRYMPDRIVTAPRARAAQPPRLARLLLCMAMTGCASGGDGVFVFADVGKYQYHNCEQLTAAGKAQSERQRKLKELIDKAEQGAGGQIVSLIAYRADYVAIGEDLRVIDTTARSKNCLTSSSRQSSSAIQ
jgi:hypothetical protein